MGFVPADAATKGGYARPLTPEEQAEQAKMVAEHLKGQDIVVTTAQIPGRQGAADRHRANGRESMKPGSVVLDMAAESGGNVEGSKPGETVNIGGVKIIGARTCLARIAPATTLLYAKQPVQLRPPPDRPRDKELKIDTADELVKGTLLTRAARSSTTPSSRRPEADSSRWKRSTPASST